MNALEKYELDTLESNDIFQEKEQWGIGDLGSANWALRKITALEEANKEIQQLADEERKRIDDWESKETQSNHDAITFFKQKLGEYLLLLRQSDPKAKIKTPYGSVTTRKKPDSWEYGEQAIAELEAAGLDEFITTKVTKSVTKTEFKKAVSVTENGNVVTPDGEVLESVKVVPQGFDIVVKGAK